VDFQALPRRRFKKKSIGLLTLVLLIPALLFFSFNLYLAIMKDLGFAGPDTRVENTGGTGLLFSSAIGFLIYCWKLRRQQRQLQQALRDLDLVRLTKDGKVELFLYLRSFRMGRSTLLRRLVPYFYGDQSLLDAAAGAEVVHFEEDISIAIDPHGLLIAIGDRNDSYGAGKIVVSDDKWKEHFHWLATHSRTIFVQPDLTESVKWEVSQLLGNSSYLHKTAWVMPRGGKDKWSEIRDGLRQDIGVVLPPHHADGSVFRLRPDSPDVPVALNRFMPALTRVFDQANRDGEQYDIDQVWEQIAVDERDTRANDEALRRIRGKIPLLNKW
jgi:hypothetical protein